MLQRFHRVFGHPSDGLRRRAAAVRLGGESFAVDGGDSTGLGRRPNPVESGDIREELIGPIAVCRFDTLPPTAPNSEKTGLPLRQEMLPEPFRQNSNIRGDNDDAATCEQ